jgi:hypothetical protein
MLNNMYTIIPKNLLATAYDIYYDNKLVAHLKKPAVSIKDNCSVIIGGKQFDFRRQGVVSGDWILETLDHITVASAVKPSVFSDTFVIHFDTNELTLKAKFLSLKNECILFDKDRQRYRARIRNHGHSCFLCEIVIRSQFHTTYEPEA